MLLNKIQERHYKFFSLRLLLSSIVVNKSIIRTTLIRAKIVMMGLTKSYEFFTVRLEEKSSMNSKYGKSIIHSPRGVEKTST
jgi:hypothetical protein